MRKNLSQQKLLEILTSEIELLEQTTKDIKEVAPEIARQLNHLKTAKIRVDLNTYKLEQLLDEHKKELKKSVVIPRWFLFVIAGVLLASVIKWFLVFV